MKKKRKRSAIKKMQKIIDRTAQNLERHGIPQDRLTIRLGGVRTHRWQPPKTQDCVQK